jgi:hypothetical protein
MSELAPDLVRRLLDYDPETGVLTWRARTPDMFEEGKHSAKNSCAAWNGQFAGRAAGVSREDGYRRVMVLGKNLFSHRIAWAIMTGSWPREQIDHINGIKNDNRFINLREASCSQNAMNVPAQKNNTSGFKGVSWDKSCSKWRAEIMREKTKHVLGWFDRVEDASSAYQAAAKEMHREFARVS